MTAPTGTVTLLFTDIVGSTKLWESHPEAMALALKRHDAILRTAIEAEGGYVFKTVGDAFCAAFSVARAAAMAAVTAQRALLAEDWPDGARVSARMALHTGSCEERDGDYFGPVVNRAARLEATAHGGQIVASRATADLLYDVSPALVLRDLGEHRLKDLGRPERVFQIDAEGLPSHFPSLRSLDNPEMQNNLPAQLSSFVGRETEIARVSALLAEARLVTLVGSGGCGKTRLALQVAADEVDGSADGVWLVDLGSLGDPDLVASATATALNVREESGRPVADTLYEALADRNLLLVLDNCEHLVDACAKLVDALLRNCPRIVVLATSREPLSISGEQVFRVPSLSLPPRVPETSLAEASRSEAVALFCERAHLHRQEFALDETTVAPVVSLCRHLDGIPLAIELAAARLQSMSVADIESRLNNRLRLLTGGSRTAVPRQQTLRALIAWSYDLLGSAERTVLCRLSVFSGGFALDTAEAVCATEDLSEFEIFDLLDSLVAKSLVQTEPWGDSVRYWLLETIRDYALEKLAETGDETVAAIRDRHALTFLALAEKEAPAMLGAQQSRAVVRLEAEHDNLYSAMTHLLGQPGRGTEALRLGLALRYFWLYQSHLVEGADLLNRCLSAPGLPDLLLAAGLAAAAELDHRAGEMVRRALDHCERGLLLAREFGALDLVADLLVQRSWANFKIGDYDAAVAAASEAVAVARQGGNPQVLAQALRMSAPVSGLILNHPGALAPEVVREREQEALVIFREHGNREGTCSVLTDLGLLELYVGNYDASRRFYEAAETEYLSDELRPPNPERLSTIHLNLAWGYLSEGDVFAASAELLRSLKNYAGDLPAYQVLAGALCLAASGQPVEAARLLGCAEHLLGAAGEAWEPLEGRLAGATRETLQQQLGADTFETAYEEGSKLAKSDALALVGQQLKTRLAGEPVTPEPS